MRVLWLSNETPDVEGQGGQRRQHFQIKSLVDAGHRVTISTLAGSQSDARIRCTAEVVRRRPQLFGRVVNPIDWMQTRSLFDRDWDRIVVAHTESWVTWRSLLLRSEAPLLVDMHNVLSDWHRGTGKVADAKTWLEVEREILQHASVVTVCSAKQKLALERDLSKPDLSNAIALLPHGIDTDEWKRRPQPSARPVIKLFGDWRWEPNRKGLDWFLSKVWPEVSVRGAVSCEVAGRTMHVQRYEGVTFLGHVLNVPDFLHDAWIVGVPVIEGVGAPVKYAEALASGVPVVATPDGSPFDEPSGFVVSDEPRKWIEGILGVLSQPTESRTMSAVSRSRVFEQWNWDTVNAPLNRWVSTGPDPSEGPIC